LYLIHAHNFLARSLESSKLTPKKKKEKEEEVDPAGLKEFSFEYFPPTQILLRNKDPNHRELIKGKLSIYDRLEAKKEEILKKRFSYEKEEELGQGWRPAGQTRQGQDSDSEDEGTEGRRFRAPFDGIKLSSLVGNRAAALQVRFHE
jgi:hypothetical protein